MLGFDGLVIEADAVGKRPGMRYRVVLLFPEGVRATAIVYMRWDDVDAVTHLWCYFHRSAGCQCIHAVNDLRKEAGIDDSNQE